jgi:hypothetical protein
MTEEREPTGEQQQRSTLCGAQPVAKIGSILGEEGGTDAALLDR